MSAATTPAATELPEAWATATAVWRFNVSAVTVDAGLTNNGGLTSFRTGVAALSGAAPADVVLVSAAAIPCAAGSSTFPCPAASTSCSYLVTNIRDGFYAPARAHKLELAAEDAARVHEAFQPLAVAGLYPELRHTSALPNYSEVNRTAYNRDFGL